MEITTLMRIPYCARNYASTRLHVLDNFKAPKMLCDFIDFNGLIVQASNLIHD